jgi:hypothetical protein
MRIPALAILTTVTILTAAPTLAQTCSPDYPVCLHVYSENGGIECAYTSLAAVQRVGIGSRRASASQIHILRARKCRRDHMTGGTAASTEPMSRDQRFFDPIMVPGRKPLATLRDAAEYITELPKAEHDADEWQAAMEALLLVART